MLIIGFGHRKRVGKDTAVGFLMTQLRLNIKRVNIIKGSFAYPLKKQCHELWGWAGLREPEFYDTEEGIPYREYILPKLGKTPRQVWIEYGNKVRDIYPGTWVDLQIHIAKNIMKANILLLADVRYPNETQAIKNHGGKVYKIERNDAPISHDVADTALLDYEGWEGVLSNNGTLNEFDSLIYSTIAEPIIKEWHDKKSIGSNQ